MRLWGGAKRASRNDFHWVFMIRLDGYFAVAVIKVEPIVRRPENQSSRRLHRLMSRTADLKVDAVLPLEQDLAIVQPTRHIHRSIGANKLLVRE